MERSKSSPSLAEALAAVTPAQIGLRCVTCATLETMNGEDREALSAALKGALSASTISKALAAAGYSVSRGSLQRHRRGECKPVH